MKIMVLSLKHPWAELIVSGRKTIELRTWNTKFRGVFYIQASNNTNKQACKEFGLKPEALDRMMIIGKCELIGVKHYPTKQELINDSDKHCAINYKVPCYGFLLKSSERIKPIPCKGQLGFFRKTLKTL